MNQTQSILELNIALVQMAIDNQPMKNAQKFLYQATLAVEQGADVVIGSEMMLSHYVCGDRYEEEGFVDEMWSTAVYIASQWRSEAVLIFGGIALDAESKGGEDGRRRKYNAAFVIQNGSFVFNKAGLPFAIKSLMPNYRYFDDSRHFFDLRKLADEQGLVLKDLQQPFPVTIRGTEHYLGVMICEDMWDADYAQKPAKNLADNGADILINLSASPWGWQKNRKRDQVVQTICKATGLAFVYVNNVGSQNNGKNFLVFDGASSCYDQKGNLVAIAKRYEEVTMVMQFASKLTSLKREASSDVAELFTGIKVATLGFLCTLPTSVKGKVVIGVSGGIDSALSLALFVHLMGPENVIAINMPYGSFNSADTKDDAKEMCRRLGVEYRIIPIDEMVNTRARLTGVLVGSSAHKTVQAIERKSVEAALAAKLGAFLICNANMTEIAFGYGTLNADLRGTFAPWMNCLKQDVYRLGHYMNEVVYSREVILQSIMDRQPMDELTEAGTSARGDPFDYGSVSDNGYHDQMVRALVAFRWSAESFLQAYQSGSLESDLQLPTGKLASLFPTTRDFVEDLERCMDLFHAAIFKRVQSVPGPVVDKRSFGFDFRESILKRVETVRYKKLKEELLKI
jgi:NAD+ synthase (glutamine-hydrolysing)